MSRLRKNDITIVCSRLDMPGGTERAIVNLSNLLSKHGYKVVILILDTTDQLFYPLDPKVLLIQKKLDFGLSQQGTVFSRKWKLVRHLKQLRGLLKKINSNTIIGTDYVFTICAWMASNGNQSMISWEHHHFKWLNKNRFWTFLFNNIYPRIDKVLCLNEIESKLYKQLGCTTSVIPNFISQRRKATLEEKIILSVGWLIKRKGVDLIPSIAEIVFQRHPDWQWRIIGIGEESEELKRKIEEHNLAQNISVILPSGPDLEQDYLSASIYVMTSRFECFPMVLLEAMSHGVPCISYNCPTGPADIIKHEEDGLLVEAEDIDGMADAICRLIENEEVRKRMGENAHRNILRFSPENIFKLWEAVLHPTTQQIN